MQVQVPETRYAHAGGINIAYQVLGEGPFDLVYVPDLISSVELVWENPRLASAYRRLASLSRLIIFDRRGTGQSDRVGGAPSLEERMDDVRAVMDAVGSERAALFGAGNAGAMTALFAATHPQRTVALVLWAMQPREMWAPDYPWGLTDEQARRYVDEGERRFGDPAYVEEVASRLIPSSARDEEVRRWVASTWRLSLSPGALAAFRRMNLEIDVRHVLPTIRVPTLVLHRADDHFTPAEVSKYVAEQIPGATYLELPGIDHILWSGDFEPAIAEVATFVSRAVEEGWEEEPERVLATVLFTDIVGSTEKAVELGDRAWRQLVQQHHETIRRQLSRFRGKEVDTAGDGFFASFDGPARAIRCATTITEAVRELGIDVRAGVHTGECEVIDGKVGGIAVHIGARVASQAGPGEVLVSSTVRDLVAGSGIRFADRGVAELKGIPGEWRLFAVE